MKKLLFALPLILALFYFGCDSTEPDGTDNSDIPQDPAGVTIPLLQFNNILPTGNFTLGAGNRVKVNLQGLINPKTNQPIQLFYDANNPASSNIFLSEDGVVKGLKVTKVSTGNTLKADVVFVVDNSGSMGEEADSVANGIISFANFLQASGLDVRFGVVGYYGQVNGALNFTTAQALSNYLNRVGYSGTSRTEGFAGPDSASLQNRASNFANTVYDENGVVAALFADSVFSWRGDAQRVIINFTDESTQPDNALLWNTATMCAKLSGKATVHTVYSGPADTSYGLNGPWGPYHERPWKMSECTGGTIKFVPQDASGLNLKNLPVAGALSNSYLVEYVAGSTGKVHTVIIAVKTNDADGKQEFSVNY
ncbi:MAG: VWA domain-containing protein [Ignavibacteriaceae bacterium]|nr:VWA domain-containing protein [Ignavibacteriaceae bacterium]